MFCKIKNDDFIFKININQLNIIEDKILFYKININDLKNILLSDYNINSEQYIFIKNGIILDNNYIIQNNDNIILIKENSLEIKINYNNNKLFNNSNNNYSQEIHYLKTYPELIPFIYLIKDNPIYLETFIKELNNNKTTLYNIIKTNQKLFINLFNINDKIINNLISKEEHNNNNNNISNINEDNSIIIELEDSENNNDIQEICDIFPNILKDDIINFYYIFNCNKETIIDFLYENYDI